MRKMFSGPIIKRLSTVSLSMVACLIVIFMVARTDHHYKLWKHANRIIAWDVICYYQYLPMTFIYKDISGKFIKEGKKDFTNKIWMSSTENGRYVGRMTMGIAVLYSPFFAVAHLLAGTLGYEADGFTAPYSFSIMAASLFYLAFGLFLMRKLLLKYFPEITTALTLLIIGLGTNLFYYTTIEPGMSHAFSFFLIASFLLLLDGWLEKPTPGRAILIGLVIGMIILIRPTNVVIILFFLLWKIGSISALAERIKFLTGQIPLLLLLTAAVFLVTLPQLLYWKYVTGHFFFNYYRDQNIFFFGNPQFVMGLFSYRKGWLVYTPVMGLALLGLIVLAFRQRKWFFGVFIFTLVNLYVVFSWWCWWYGGGFGMRPLIESYAVMALPLAAFISWIMDQKIVFRGCLVLVLSFFIYLNIFQTKQYYQGGLIHWDSMSREAYWDSFLRKKPSPRFQQLLRHPDYSKAMQGIYVDKEKLPAPASKDDSHDGEN